MFNNLATSDALVNDYPGLSKFDQFIVCKFVASAKRAGKTDKLPCDEYGYPASLHEAVRMSLGKAQALAKGLSKATSSKYGVGFVLTEKDPFFCVDIDHCVSSLGYNDVAQELMTRFHGALFEYSNSGTGLHIWGKYLRDIPHGCRDKEGKGLELYTKDRFIALGKPFEGSADKDCSAQLNALISRYFPTSVATTAAEWTTTHCEGSNPIQDDDKLITKACAATSAAGVFSAKSTFRDLWEKNVEKLADAYPDPSGDYDESKADAALAYSLMFWTGRNCERVESLMRKSALKRDKWDSHRGYLRKFTIPNALTAHIEKSAAVYSVGAPTLPATPMEVLPVPEVQPFEALHVAKGTCVHNDHVLDADILRTSVFNSRLVDFSGAPYWWNGQKWEFAEESLMRRYVGESMVRALGQDGPKATQSRINGTLAVMRDRLDRMGALNPASRQVYFRNGVLDIDTGELSPHSPENRNGNILTCDYAPVASCKVWQAWLAEIFQSDLDRVELLQEIIGWSLITDNLGIQKAPIFIGAQRAGKGTILNVVSKLLNDAAGAFQLPNLDNDKVLAGMTQRNVVIDYDCASPDKKNARQIVGLFKAITANEPVSVKLLYTQVPFQGALNCKLLLASNSVPTMWDDSTATANRWMPLVFDRSFLGAEDTTLSNRLAEELPGIAVWALEGLRRLMSNGRFTMPESSLAEMDYMVESGSPVTRFMDEECVFEAGARVADNALWSRYTDWCRVNEMEQMKRKNFLSAFKDASVAKGVRSAKSVRINDSDHRGFYGVTVRPIVFEQQQNVTPLSAVR